MNPTAEAANKTRPANNPLHIIYSWMHRTYVRVLYRRLRALRRNTRKVLSNVRIELERQVQPLPLSLIALRWCRYAYICRSSSSSPSSSRLYSHHHDHRIYSHSARLCAPGQWYKSKVHRIYKVYEREYRVNKETRAHHTIELVCVSERLMHSRCLGYPKTENEERRSLLASVGSSLPRVGSNYIYK